MTRASLRPLLLCATLLPLLACTPALNWREVQLGRLTVQLPCKPDRGERSLPLGQSTVVIDMAGCETEGALFAVSHIHVDTAAEVEPVLRAWRAGTLANLRAGETARVASGAASLATPLQVSGLRPGGEPVQARLAWQVSGTDLYHLAVYAQTIQAEMTDMMFNQAKVQ